MQATEFILPRPHQSRPLTRHATVRMQQRGISAQAVDAVLTYGRTIRAKGITYRVIGHKEVKRYASAGIDLTAIEGVQVLVGADGAVVTVYKNRDLHAIKVTPRRGPASRCH